MHKYKYEILALMSLDFTSVEHWETSWFYGYNKIMMFFILFILPQLGADNKYNRKISEMLFILFKT